MTNEEKILSMLSNLTNDMADMKARQDKLEIILENDIKPTQQLILEAVAPLAKKAQQPDELPELRETVELHTAAIKNLGQRVTALEKAQ